MKHNATVSFESFPLAAGSVFDIFWYVLLLEWSALLVAEQDQV